jgi:hypothetical protein
LTRDFEFIVYSHRPHPWQAEFAESLFRVVPQTTRLTIIREPGTAAQNSNRALDIATARYLFLCDEDVLFFQEGWLEAMLGMTKLPDFGLGSCREVPNRERAAAEPQRAELGPVHKMNGMAGYVFLFDMQRMAGLRLDEGIPGGKGMSDTDICLQARLLRGLGVYRNEGACIVHQAKPLEAGPRLAAGFTSTIEQEVREWWPEQCRYMDRKYGVNKWTQ